MAKSTMPPSHPIDRGVFLFATAACLMVQAFGGSLGGPVATGATCVLILVFGLPHGSLDLELIKGQHALSSRQSLLTLGLYVLLAVAMFALWCFDPVIALLAFVTVSIVHFAEDWAETGSEFLALGLGAALLGAPVVLHADEVSALFVALAGHPSGRLVTDLLRMIAPVGLLVAAVGLYSLWIEGRRAQALDGLCALLAMLALPPAVGFALFFCLLHSPRHLRANLDALASTRRGGFAGIVVLLTAAGIGIATAIHGAGSSLDGPADVVRASFMTLSVLVVPHMAVPVIVAALGRSARPSTPNTVPASTRR